MWSWREVALCTEKPGLLLYKLLPGARPGALWCTDMLLAKCRKGSLHEEATADRWGSIPVHGRGAVAVASWRTACGSPTEGYLEVEADCIGQRTGEGLKLSKSLSSYHFFLIFEIITYFHFSRVFPSNFPTYLSQLFFKFMAVSHEWLLHVYMYICVSIPKYSLLVHIMLLIHMF